MYTTQRKYVGQFLIIANRLFVEHWKVQVIDMDVEDAKSLGGRLNYASEGWKTWQRAIADGEKFLANKADLARFRLRWRYDRVARAEKKSSV